ncbi:MAG: hypothetical protein HYU80_03290 [Candidatus Blackburnbacteria bacterium]|nr:hypothetical protein [Candidatus Blackburnbacteria bacterium]
MARAERAPQLAPCAGTVMPTTPETQLWSVLERAQELCGFPHLVQVNPVVDESDINFRLPEELRVLYDHYMEERPNWETELYESARTNYLSTT